MADQQPRSATDELQSELRQPPPAAPVPATTPPPAASTNGKAKSATDVLQDELRRPPATTQQTETPPPTYPPSSEFGDLGNAWWNTQATPPPGTPSISIGSPPPAAPAATTGTVALGSTDAPGALGTTPGMGNQPAVVAATTVPTVAEAQNALQPAPGTEYGYYPWEPIARDTKTGQLRFAMPTTVRNTLLGLTEGPDIANYGMTSATTWDPKTGTYGVTPEASTAANLLFSEGGLQFGGVPAVRAVPAPGAPGYVQPPIPPGTATNLLTPEARARIAEAAAPSTAPASPTGVRVTPPAPLPGEPAAAPPAAAAATPPTAAPVVPSPAAAPAAPVWRPVEEGESLPAGAQTRVNQATGDTETTAPSAPQPAGAQVTPDSQIPEATRAQRLTNLRHDLEQTAVDRAGPGMQDDTQYVSEVRGLPVQPRTLASRQFHPLNSRDEQYANYTDMAFRNQSEGITRERYQAMSDMLRDDARDDNALGDANEARQAASPDARQVFTNETPVDASGLQGMVRAAMDSRAGRRGGVARILQNVSNSLVDKDGNLLTSPDQIYGARQNITDILDKGKGTDSEAKDARAAKAILEDFLPAFDAKISEGAPGYRPYMDEYRRLSIPINQMEFLQQYQPGGAKNIFGADGKPLFSKVQGMLKDIYQGNKARGVNPAKDLTDEQIQNVVNVRNELAAEDLRDKGAAVKGSNTFQMLHAQAASSASPLGAAVRGAVGAGAKIGAAYATHGLSPIVVAPVEAGVKAGLSARALQRINAAVAQRKTELLSQNPATDPAHPRVSEPPFASPPPPPTAAITPNPVPQNPLTTPWGAPQP